MDLQHLDEAHQVLLEKSHKAKGKAPMVDEGAPIRAPFVPRSVQVPGGRFQRGGRGGGRGPLGRTGFQATMEVTDSSEGIQVDPQVFEERPKQTWASLLTNRCPTGDLESFESKDPNHPEEIGNIVSVEMQPAVPSEEGLLGENVQGFAKKGSFVEEEPAYVEVVSRVSSAEAIQDAQASPVVVIQSQTSVEEGPGIDRREALNPPASMKMETMKSKPHDRLVPSFPVRFWWVLVFPGDPAAVAGWFEIAYFVF
ncbi:hypothetical protein U1Q18_032548 [Sarracenia purpurea var. burkii]